MLSNKMTFSLTFLVTLIAVGLVFAPSVMADGDAKKTHFDLKVEIMPAESMIDVSSEGDPAKNIQIATGRDRASRQIHSPGAADDPTANALIISLLVKFSHVVNLAEPGARIPLEDIDESTANEPKPSGGDFGADDLYAAAYDKEGRALGVLSLAEASSSATSISQFRDAGGVGREFLVRIDETQLRNAYINRGVASGYEIYSLVFFIPKGIPGAVDIDPDKDATVTRGIRKFDRAHAIAHFAPDAHQHMNDKSNEFQVDLVDDDQGDPQYAVLTGPGTAQDVASNGLPPNDAVANQGSGTPGVVSIMRTVDRSGFVESGDFDVRIILTEEPMGGLTADKVMVINGTVKSVVKGATYKGGHPERAAIAEYIPADTTVTPNLPAIPLPAVPKMDSQLGPTMINYYHAADDATAAVTSPVEDAATATNGTVANFPQATGRDNKYHSYIATITPNYGHTGSVTISIKQFNDSVKPVPNTYVPLTAEQRVATTLTDAAEIVRDARLMNESLTVQVSVGADPKIKAATDAYETRKKVYDGIGTEIVLGNKLYIPKDGHLVLVGDRGKAGIADPKVKTKDKLTAAQKLYNTSGLGLPFPADDLSNFFRNGGTLRLGYADIPEATGSGHGDSKGATGDDATGYTEADSTAYAAGDLIFNEIMWGLDGNTTDAQYIELHNTTGKAIGIDNREWVITVNDALPTGFTLIDTVSNQTATGGAWKVPGSDGVSKVEPNAGFFSLVDIVSMSRIEDATDGTAAASWAMSVAPSVNLSGRRVGSPGAANDYDTSAADAKAAADKAAADADESRRPMPRKPPLRQALT